MLVICLISFCNLHPGENLLMFIIFGYSVCNSESDSCSIILICLAHVYCHSSMMCFVAKFQQDHELLSVLALLISEESIEMQQ